MAHLFEKKYAIGDRVDYVPKGLGGGLTGAVNAQGIGGGTISFGNKSAFQKAKETGEGARTRGVIDAVLDDGTYRIMLCNDDCTLVWAGLDEIEDLDAVSQLADAVTCKTIEEQMAEIDRQEAEEKSRKERPQA